MMTKKDFTRIAKEIRMSPADRDYFIEIIVGVALASVSHLYRLQRRDIPQGLRTMEEPCVWLLALRRRGC